MGLVTNKVWLVGMTYEFKSMVRNGELVELSNDLHRVTQAELVSEQKLMETAEEVLSKYELAAYVANMGGTFSRVA